MPWLPYVFHPGCFPMKLAKYQTDELINQVKKIKEIGKRITSRDTGKLDILKHAQQFYKSYPECVLNLFKVCIIVYSLGLGQNIIWKKKKYTNMTSIL